MNPVNLYLQVRRHEGRIFPDEVVQRLPDLPAHHPLYGEWQARLASYLRLERWMAHRPRPLDILDAGCGNGWLSNLLARISGAQVIGFDRNPLELCQAQRLFTRPNLRFLESDLLHPPFGSSSFDAIVLSSVIQYIPDLPALLRSLLPLLKPRGEIHLLDSPLYTAAQLRNAQARTAAYYQALGFPEMAACYFHHTVEALEGFSPRWRYRPHPLWQHLARRLRRPASPFPWVSVAAPTPTGMAENGKGL